MGRKGVFNSSWEFRDQISTETERDTGTSDPMGLMLQGKEAKILGRRISNHTLTQLPAQEVLGERSWKKGKMEIARSQLSQGPRGCCMDEEEQGLEIHSPRVTAVRMEGEGSHPQPGAALLPRAAKIWEDRPSSASPGLLWWSAAPPLLQKGMGRL